MVSRGIQSLVFLLASAVMGSTAAASDPAEVTARAMGACLIDASNTASKLRPSFRLDMIHLPIFEKTFEDHNDVGQPITVARYKGKIDVTFAGRRAEQLYSCTFWKDSGEPWAFSWSGLGATHVEGFR